MLASGVGKGTTVYLTVVLVERVLKKLVLILENDIGDDAGSRVDVRQ